MSARPPREKGTDMDTTTTVPSAEEWRAIAAQFQAPFDPDDVDFRFQGKAGKNGLAQVVAYIDARAVQDRLDAVVGSGNWSFDWIPLITANNDVQVAKGLLTVYGVMKADAGTASNFEQSLGAVSHCFKRAAVQWGIGRYLYSLPQTWEPYPENGQRVPAATLRKLRASLPRPVNAQTATRTPAATTTATTTARSGEDEEGVGDSVGESARDATLAQPAHVRGPVNVRAPRDPAAGEPSVAQQHVTIRKLATALDEDLSALPAGVEGLTFAQAGDLIMRLSKAYQARVTSRQRQPQRAS